MPIWLPRLISAIHCAQERQSGRPASRSVHFSRAYQCDISRVVRIGTSVLHSVPGFLSPRDWGGGIDAMFANCIYHCAIHMALPICICTHPNATCREMRWELQYHFNDSAIYRHCQFHTLARALIHNSSHRFQITHFYSFCPTP